MAENLAAAHKERIEKEKQVFDNLRQGLIKKLENLIGDDVWKDILEKKILADADANEIKDILKKILNDIRERFNTMASKWILDIIYDRIYNFESLFHLLRDGIEENKKNETIQYIGAFEQKKTFEAYGEINLLPNAIYIFNLVDYLVTLYENLKNQAQQVALLGNNHLVEKIESTRNDLVKEVEDFRRLRNIADNAKTENIYNNAVVKYRKYEWGYRIAFFLTLALVFGVSLWFWNSDYLNNIINKPSYASSAIFWSVKITSLIACITLLTYFLKQSSHHQKLADQNYQTQLELQAYPSFMESIPTEEAASVRKELALKYFGRELEKNSNKTNSSLLVDQVKASTDLVKAATELTKSVGKENFK